MNCTLAQVIARHVLAPLIYYRHVVPPKQPSRGANRGDALIWIREAVREQGWLGALRHYCAEGVEMLRDQTPSRRRSRYGDIDYDFDHGVDTTWANVPLRTRFRELLSGGRYQPSEPSLFHQILHSLPVAPNGFTFIDLGSGKGRTLLMASDYPFRRIVGVEFLVELEIIARQNIARYRGERQKCFVLESQGGDARDFEFPAEPTVLYLFNPFPEDVLRAVLARLHNSVDDFPRPVYVLYHNLVHEKIFVQQEWLQPVYRTPLYAIYQVRSTTAT